MHGSMQDLQVAAQKGAQRRPGNSPYVMQAIGVGPATVGMEAGGMLCATPYLQIDL